LKKENQRGFRAKTIRWEGGRPFHNATWEKRKDLCRGQRKMRSQRKKRVAKRCSCALNLPMKKKEKTLGGGVARLREKRSNPAVEKGYHLGGKKPLRSVGWV